MATPLPPPPKGSSKTDEMRKYMIDLRSSSHHEEHEEHVEEPNEKWLVSYADMMTLLFGFFVLMYSMSKVDSQKFADVAQSAASTFGSTYQDPTEMINRAIAKEIESIAESNDIEVKKGHMGLEINFRGKVLFDSGKAELSELGRSLFLKLAEQIKSSKQEFTVRIEGHTDDVPISTLQFPSNWELSAARAISVVKLFKEAGISDKNLEAIGYADTRPVVPNRSPAGEALQDNMAMNRRVMVRIQRTFQKD